MVERCLAGFGLHRAAASFNTPVRKDFVFDATCHVCPRHLTSNIATVLSDELGREFPFGPTCARNNLDEEGLRLLRRIPDFTKAAPREERESGRGGVGGSGGARAPHDDQDRRFRRAVTYMLLRQERLKHIPEAGYRAFSDYSASYRENNTITDAAINHILNVDRKNAGSRYDFDNLQAVYAYDCCITRAFRAL